MHVHSQFKNSQITWTEKWGPPKLLGNGSTIELACRGVGVSTASYYKWRQRYEGMSIDDAKELKELRTENSKLKRLVAEAELEKMMLREIAKGKF
jgi:transposase-like protein